MARRFTSYESSDNSDTAGVQSCRSTKQDTYNPAFCEYFAQLRYLRDENCRLKDSLKTITSEFEKLQIEYTSWKSILKANKSKPSAKRILSFSQKQRYGGCMSPLKKCLDLLENKSPTPKRESNRQPVMFHRRRKTQESREIVRQNSPIKKRQLSQHSSFRNASVSPPKTKKLKLKIKNKRTKPASQLTVKTQRKKTGTW